jgi:hypothetical protein
MGGTSEYLDDEEWRYPQLNSSARVLGCKPRERLAHCIGHDNTVIRVACYASIRHNLGLIEFHVLILHLIPPPSKPTVQVDLYMWRAMVD